MAVAVNQGDGKSRAGRSTPVEPGGGAAEEPRETEPGPAEAPVGWGRFLVAPRPLGMLPGGVPPIEFPVLMQLLEEDEEVRVLSRLRPARSRGLGAIAEPHPFCPPVAVVAMPAERAAALAVNPQVVVEQDQPLIYPVVNPLAPAVAAADPGLAVPMAEPVTLTVRVTGGAEGDPVVGAHVWAIGTTAPGHAVTDRTGTARLTLAADTLQTVRAVHVRPAGGYWPRVEGGAGLPLEDGNAEMTVRLRPLSDTFEGFPATAVVGWGAQAMRLTQIPPTFRGHGVKIALLDSGIAISHPDLKDCVVAGQDFVVGGEHGWDRDATGHGTWCAGVIAAADNQTGIAGIAADAHLYSLKLFPGGYTSHLLQALDWCAGNEIDLAQINLAIQAPSQLLAWKILDVRTAGTTVIAPAGDTGTTPAFPAALPTVIGVGALAHTGTTLDGRLAPGAKSGPYTPDFTPVGADLVAPGTAVLTTSVDGDYTIADGTALAAAHVTALAALLLAHHDQLRTPLTARTQARADHLTAWLRASCHPVPGTDPARLGAGLPDAPVALGTATPFTTGLMTPAWPSAAQYATPRT